MMEDLDKLLAARRDQGTGGTRTCAVCGKVSSADHFFCPVCGARMDFSTRPCGTCSMEGTGIDCAACGEKDPESQTS